jgi:hypothetical protein
MPIRELLRVPTFIALMVSAWFRNLADSIPARGHATVLSFSNPFVNQYSNDNFMGIEIFTDPFILVE